MVNPGCRLLFVDDEETILFAVQDYFEPQGYEVDAVSDAERAQALLNTHAYAVAVIDLSLGRPRPRARPAWHGGCILRVSDIRSLTGGKSR
jgi:CheY-like chemotaxis protein